MEENKDMYKKIIEQIDKKLEVLTKEGIQQNNIDYVGKLVKAKKDISKIKKLESEGESNMYRGYDGYGAYDGYGTYNGGRSRDSQGRYMGNNYGRRYRGHDMIDNVAEHYGTYMENRENGRYGSPEMNRALDYMLQSVEEFMNMLKKDASSQEEVEKIKRTARKISEM